MRWRGSRNRLPSGTNRDSQVVGERRDADTEDPDNLAREVIDQLHLSQVKELGEAVIRQQLTLDQARRALAAAERDQAAWLRDGSFEVVLGPRALLMAQIADFRDHSGHSAPHLAAMVRFLKAHHPPRPAAKEAESAPPRAVPSKPAGDA